LQNGDGLWLLSYLFLVVSNTGHNLNSVKLFCPADIPSLLLSLSVALQLAHETFSKDFAEN
jgi:hypothetical protein